MVQREIRQFLGGTSTTVEFNEAYTLAQADDEIVPKIAEVIGNNDVQTQVVDNTNQIIFKTRSLDLEQREALKARLEKIREQLEKEQSRVLNSSSGASEDTICSLRKEYEEKHTEYAHEILRRITEV